MMEKEKISIISANESFRKGLSQILNETDNIASTHCDTSCDASVAVLYNFDPNVIIVDVQFPSMTEIETINCLIDKYPEANILALLPVNDYFAAIELINHGVKGVVTHAIGLQELQIALQAIKHKDSYCSNSILKTIKDQYYKSTKQNIPLSEEEIKLLKDIATANTAAESCEKLSISLEEYSMTRSKIFEKTNCTTNSSLAAFSFMTIQLPSAQ